MLETIYLLYGGESCVLGARDIIITTPEVMWESILRPNPNQRLFSKTYIVRFTSRICVKWVDTFLGGRKQFAVY